MAKGILSRGLDNSANGPFDNGTRGIIVLAPVVPGWITLSKG